MNRRKPHVKPAARPLSKSHALAIAPTIEQTVTLPDSGYEATLQIPKVSLGLVFQQIQRSNPRPLPPKQIVSLMGKDTLVENTADPDYEERLSEWQGNVAMLQMEAQLKLMLVNVPTDKELSRVSELRNTVGEVIGLRSMSDYDVWLNFVVIQSDKDQITLMQTMADLLNPSEQEVDEVTDTFQR